ncbi:hypothetical protein BC834DRAFT_905613 [Gloeopeniophorella convolvens]|nr:hypothetical protein BC834DRAFT_905613 [Gloeopeniophorella convolvens]
MKMDHGHGLECSGLSDCGADSPLFPLSLFTIPLLTPSSFYITSIALPLTPSDSGRSPRTLPLGPPPHSFSFIYFWHAFGFGRPWPASCPASAALRTALGFPPAALSDFDYLLLLLFTSGHSLQTFYSTLYNCIA